MKFPSNKEIIPTVELTWEFSAARGEKLIDKRLINLRWKFSCIAQMLACDENSLSNLDEKKIYISLPGKS